MGCLIGESGILGMLRLGEDVSNVAMFLYEGSLRTDPFLRSIIECC